MARQKKTLVDWSAIVEGLLWPAVTAIGVMLAYTFMAGKMIVTNSDLKATADESRMYTDKTAAEMLSKAYEHSDANRRDMQIEMGKQNSENREAMAKVSTSLDMVLRSVQSMRDESWTHDHRRSNTSTEK
jgi:hypothetical protein